MEPIKVSDIMTRTVITVSKETPVSEIARLMKKYQVGSVIVVKDNYPVGIVTQGDIIRRVVAEGKDANSTKAGEIMSTNLVTVSPDADVLEAAKIMQMNRVKRLPVVKNGKLIGIITETDITYHSPDIVEILRFRDQLGPIGEFEEEYAGEKEEVEFE